MPQVCLPGPWEAINPDRPCRGRAKSAAEQRIRPSGHQCTWQRSPARLSTWTPSSPSVRPEVLDRGMTGLILTAFDPDTAGHPVAVSVAVHLRPALSTEVHAVL